tara:strand:- start:6278 stop:6667 length:390 start_codon:yes stop_codon:yes gene_type:complete
MSCKVCVKCGENKPIKDYWSAGVKNGKKHLRRTCKDCYRNVKKNYKKRKKEWYTNLKKNLSCDKCGYSNLTHPSFSPNAIQFHHPNDDKEFSIGDAIHTGYSRKRIVEEIKKCRVLCARCHAEEHDKLN